MSRSLATRIRSPDWSTAWNTPPAAPANPKMPNWPRRRSGKNSSHFVQNPRATTSPATNTRRRLQQISGVRHVHEWTLASETGHAYFRKTFPDLSNLLLFHEVAWQKGWLWKCFCTGYRSHYRGARYHAARRPTDAYAAAGCTVRSSRDAQVSQFYHRGHGDASFGHWGKRRGIQCYERTDPASAECARGAEPVRDRTSKR